MTITKEQILEEAKIYRSLTNDITEAWTAVLKWKKISQAELSRRTSISEKSIGYIIQGRKSGSVDNVVLMCLGANLPGEISEHLLKLSGHVLMPANEDHIIYRYLLFHKNEYSIPEIREFLQEIGTTIYMKFPAITGNM